MSIDCVVLGEDQQLELSRIAQSRSLSAGYVLRARLILMLAEGATFSRIGQEVGDYGADHQPLAGSSASLLRGVTA
jgi:hypothetical protein